MAHQSLYDLNEYQVAKVDLCDDHLIYEETDTVVNHDDTEFGSAEYIPQFEKIKGFSTKQCWAIYLMAGLPTVLIASAAIVISHNDYWSYVLPVCLAIIAISTAISLVVFKKPRGIIREDAVISPRRDSMTTLTNEVGNRSIIEAVG